MADRLARLIAVAADLNTKMKLEPPIDTDTDSAKELKQRILAEMEVDGGQLYDTDVDTLDSATWEYLTTGLNIEPKQAPSSGGTGKANKSTEQKEDAMAVKKESAKKAAAKKKTTPAKKKEAPKAAAKKKAAPAKKGTGVIATIRKIIFAAKTKKVAISKEDILKDMVKAFPDREEKSLKNTINVQVPSRISKETDFDVVKTDEGLYYVKKK